MKLSQVVQQTVSDRRNASTASWYKVPAVFWTSSIAVKIKLAVADVPKNYAMFVRPFFDYNGDLFIDHPIGVELLDRVTLNSNILTFDSDVDMDLTITHLLMGMSRKDRIVTMNNPNMNE